MVGIKTTESTLQTASSIKTGVATNTSRRWGDYNGVANDPSNGNHVWVYAGWANSGNAWSSWIADTYFTALTLLPSSRPSVVRKPTASSSS